MLQRKDAVLLMPRQWIVNPEVDLANTLASYGRFLEDDYRTAIQVMHIPDAFEEYTEDTGRKFVIIGAKSVPGATAKSVFLCLKLAGAKSLTIKAPTLDEYFLILNVVQHHNTRDIPVLVFSKSSEELSSDVDWVKSLDEATDIVVFGGQETVDAFEHYENPDRRVWIHGPKFSFGIVRALDLTPRAMKDICSDFATFYGEGCLSPKFYIIIGEVGQGVFDEFSGYMQAHFKESIDEFRAKLPLTRRSELAQQFVSARYRNKYVRQEELNSSKLFTTLYGDARFVVIDDLDQVEAFIKKWQAEISTVALTLDDDEVMDLLEDYLVTRVCDYGYMQFPGFFEQFDVVDDFDIYTGGVEE